MVESDTARVSVLPVAGSKFPAVFLGKVALDVVSLGVGPPCLCLDSEETLPALMDERAEMNCTVPGITPDGGPLEGTPVLEPLEHSVLEMSSHDKHMEEAPVLEPLEHGWWITGEKIGSGLVCTTHHGSVRAFGSGDSCGMGAIGTFKLCCD